MRITIFYIIFHISYFQLSRQPFIRSTSHVVGVFMRTQRVQWRMWSCLAEWFSRKLKAVEDKQPACSEQARFKWALHEFNQNHCLPPTITRCCGCKNTTIKKFINALFAMRSMLSANILMMRSVSTFCDEANPFFNKVSSCYVNRKCSPGGVMFPSKHIISAVAN